jgi:hypothetical protein
LPRRRIAAEHGGRIVVGSHVLFEIAGVRQAAPRPIMKGADLPRRRPLFFSPAKQHGFRSSGGTSTPYKQRVERQVCGKP